MKKGFYFTHYLAISLSFLLTISALSGQSQTTNGLLHYYPFSGNANDAVGGNHGTVVGASLTTDRNNTANQAYDFDGINDFIYVNGIDMSDTDQVTVSVLVKPENITQNFYYNITRGYPNPAQYLLAFQSSGTILSFGINTTSGYTELDISINASDYVDSNWH